MHLPRRATVAVAAAAAILAIAAISHGVSDTDYFWHFTTGRLIAQTGQVPSTDPFSFTWFGRPWTPHEWLGELLIYVLESAFGETGLVVAFGLIAGAIILVLGAIVLRFGVTLAAIVAPLLLAVLLIGPSITIRPQVISWLLLAGLLLLLQSLRAHTVRRVWLLVPYFAIWANVHGLYVIGLGVFSIYCVFTLARATPVAGARRQVAIAGVASVACAAITPAGIVGLLYPLRYVDPGDWGLAHIFEWQSPNFHEPLRLAFLLLIVSMMAVGSRDVGGWLRFTAICGLVGGLLAVRNIPVAAVLATPALALQLQSKIDAWAPARLMHLRTPNVARVIEMAFVAVAVIALGLRFVPTGIGASAREAVTSDFPVVAVGRLEQIDPKARVLAAYGWGGYVIYRLHQEGGRVFVDGRNDMYSDSILNDYTTMVDASDGWKQLLEQYGVDSILLPPTAKLVQEAVEQGWCEAYRDRIAVLLRQQCPHDA